MGKSKHKTSNRQQYNQALVQRGSLTIWTSKLLSGGLARSTIGAEGGASSTWLNAATHAVAAAEVGLADNEVLPTLLNPL